MNHQKGRLFELVILFVAVPFSLLFDFHIGIKIVLVFFGFIYCVWILILDEKVKFKDLISLPGADNWKSVLIRFLVIATSSSLFMYFYLTDKMFVVLMTKPLLWLGILFVYSIFSVYPQELMYRTFFFHRYEGLYKDRGIMLILINASLFSFAHAFLENWLVLTLTFIGGLLFAVTYRKTRSLLFTSIEHSIYGLWLFTVGMGEMLAFPA